jgi:polysaccharide biosynthesis transport protein
LIDGDLRQPKLHKIFGAANTRGVSDVLLSEAPLETVPLSQLVVETRIAGVSLLPSGTRTTNISQLLHSPRVEALMARMRTEFDMIIIDAPPMMHSAQATPCARLL